MARRRLDSSCPIPFAADAADEGGVCTHSFDTFIQETESRLFKCGTWICKNDQFFDNVNHLGPADFVARLKENDAAAWECIRKYVVLPIFKQKKFGEMVWEKTIPFDDACGYIYEIAMSKGRISRLRSPGNLKAWLQPYVRKYIRSYYTPKDKRTESIEVRFAPKQKKIHNEMERVVENPLGRVVDEKTERQRKSGITFDEKELVQSAFTKMWIKNPKKALVLLFKCKNEMSSEDVKNFCGVSSCQNVDKILERARKEMMTSLAGKIEVPMHRKLKAQKRKCLSVRSRNGKNVSLKES